MTQALLIPIRLSDSLSISSIKVGLFDDEITPKPGLEGRSGSHQRRRGAGVETRVALERMGILKEGRIRG